MSGAGAGAPAGRGLLAERWPYLAVALAVVLADQASKWLVVTRLDLHASVTLIPGFLRFTHVVNPGGVWGVGADLADMTRLLVFLILPIAVTVFAAWYSLSMGADERLRQTCIALVVGGATGNVIDRALRQAVVDFIDVHVGEWSWPAFNVADAAICVGVGVLLVATVRERGEAPPPS